MSGRPLLLWGLLGATLLAVIAVELIDAPADQVPNLAAPRRPQAAGAAVPTGPNREWIAQSLARPLFAPDRRPAPEAAGPGLSGPPRLTGIMITPAGRSAIFVAGERQLVVQVGGVIGAFTVRDIAEQQVMLTGPSGPLVLRPSFGADGAPTGAAAGTAAAFNADVAPSGLDILRNAARQAPPVPGAAAPQPGVEQTGGGGPPAQPRPPLPTIPDFAPPPGSLGAPPTR